MGRSVVLVAPLLAAFLAATQEPVSAELPIPASEPAPATVEVVRTATYEIHLSSVGGVPLRWEIIDPQVVGNGDHDGSEGQPLALVDSRLGACPLRLDLGDERFTNQSFEIERVEEDDSTEIRFRSPADADGLQLTRTYTVPAQGFVTTVGVVLQNLGNEQVAINRQGRGVGLSLGPGLGPAPDPGSGIGSGLYSYVRPVVKVVGEVETWTIAPEDQVQPPNGVLAWGGLHRRYFLAALAPADQDASAFAGTEWRAESDLGALNSDPESARYYPSIDLFTAPVVIEPGDSVALEYRFFFGPKDTKVLRATGDGLEDVLFPVLWQWLRWLCFVLMAVLNGMHAIIPSWGLTIIAFAIVVRVIMFPVAQVGLKQQAKMSSQQAVLKAKLAEINERYKDDPTAKSQESWKVYKEHGVGPVSAAKGCLWLFVQIPIFVALFNLLGQSFALRGASFLWIADLAEPDRLFFWGIDIPFFGAYFNILPFIMAGTQVLVTKLSPAPAADAGEKKRQKVFMLGMAALFLVLFYSFPSGLVLYWMMSNLGQILQQKLVEANSGIRRLADFEEES